MPKSYIRYRSGYKYQLATSYSIPINIKPKKDIKTEFINLGTKGKLTIKLGYTWDGPSGPVVAKNIASAYYIGLKLGGKPATDPKNKKKIHRAPK